MCSDRMPCPGASLKARGESYLERVWRPFFSVGAGSIHSIITTMNRSGRIDSKKSLDGSFEGRETSVMEIKDTSTVHLRRIDPSHNMRRFYGLAIQPTLFGGASVIRHWGRIGTSGQSKIETFDSEQDAARAATRLQKAKRRRGYRDDGTA